MLPEARAHGLLLGPAGPVMSAEANRRSMIRNRSSVDLSLPREFSRFGVLRIADPTPPSTYAGSSRQRNSYTRSLSAPPHPPPAGSDPLTTHPAARCATLGLLTSADGWRRRLRRENPSTCRSEGIRHRHRHLAESTDPRNDPTHTPEDKTPILRHPHPSPSARTMCGAWYHSRIVAHGPNHRCGKPAGDNPVRPSDTSSTDEAVDKKHALNPAYSRGPRTYRTPPVRRPIPNPTHPLSLPLPSPTRHPGGIPPSPPHKIQS